MLIQMQQRTLTSGEKVLECKVMSTSDKATEYFAEQLQSGKEDYLDGLKAVSKLCKKSLTLANLLDS